MEGEVNLTRRSAQGRADGFGLGSIISHLAEPTED
jgi:hypothetical protein